jgi:hypothetical protein
LRFRENWVFCIKRERFAGALEGFGKEGFALSLRIGELFVGLQSLFSPLLTYV